MNSTIGYNARRILLNNARANEILDYLHENPKATQKAMLKTLARRWRVKERTARIPLEYLKRKKVIESKVEIVTTLKIAK